jgi:phosphatidate cytidylyltransferase
VLVGLFVILFSWYLLLSFNASGSTIINDSQGLLFSKVSFEDNLNYYFILLFVLVSLADTSAYICGKKFGSIPLAKKISPGKTLEGFLSSLLIPSVIIYFSLSYLFNMPILVVDLLFILLCCAYCTVGDLFISILKRNNNVKNSGELFRFDNLRDNSGDISTAELLPGHGGILDRIDSYFSVIPIFQLWLFL